MKHVFHVLLVLICAPVFSQSYFHEVLDGEMSVPLQFSHHTIGPDTSLISISSSGSNKSVITKVSKNGDLLWNKSFANANGIPSCGIVAFENGDVIACSAIEAPTGAIRYWIQLIKLNKDGELIWVKNSETYQSFVPQAIALKGDTIHLAGLVHQSDTQIFYMQLDSSAAILRYDSRKTDYYEEISCIGFFKEWIMLGGSSSFSDEVDPLLIAIDPGGNIRYFYLLELDGDYNRIESMSAGPDSLVCIGNSGFLIKIGYPVARKFQYYTFGEDISRIQFRHIHHNRSNEMVIVGGFRDLEGLSIMNPFIMKLGPDVQLQKATYLNEYPLTQYFGFSASLSNGDLLLGGNKQLNHYYGATVSHINADLNVLCIPVDTNFKVRNEEGGIFTYVPQSQIIRQSFIAGHISFNEELIEPKIDCVVEPPKADFVLSDSLICIGKCIEPEDVSLRAMNWEWEFQGGDQVIHQGKKPGSVCYPDSGVFSLRLIVSNPAGRDTLEKTVRVKGDDCSPYVWVPNAFSPDDNGINDVFEIRSNINTSFTLRIYSTFGEKIYEQTGASPVWDGRYQNTLSHQGWYSYRIEYQDENNRTVKLKGTVYLLNSP